MAANNHERSAGTASAGAPVGWQAQKSASTRELIIEAAIKCLVELGYARTTTTVIAEKAGLSRGAMLHHFPSKLGIIRAAVSIVGICAAVGVGIRAARAAIIGICSTGPAVVRVRAAGVLGVVRTTGSAIGIIGVSAGPAVRAAGSAA